MELINRYLHAIRFWLPASQRDDIIAELGDDLRSEIAHRAAETGREPDEIEIAAILKRRGRPEAVASHYLQPRPLIGAPLMPVYWFVLKLVVLWVLVPAFAFIVGPISVALSAHPVAAIGSTVSTLWTAAFSAAGAITIIFAIAERCPSVMDRWDPLRLPRTPGAKVGACTKITSRCNAAGELISGVVFALGWLYFISWSPEINVSGFSITQAPIWHVLQIPILLVFLSAIGLGWVSLKWPSRTRLRSRFRLSTHSYSLILIGILLAAGHWAELTVHGIAPANLADAAKWLNLSIQIGLLAVATILIIESVQEVVRLRRNRNTHYAKFTQHRF